jgi:hypothetical protein
MATQSKEQIFISIDGERVELTGEAKEAFIADRKERNDREVAREAEAKVKATAKVVAQAKLEALGLTIEDLTALGL